MTHEDIATILFLFALASAIVTGVLFVIFGEVTVRKLRRNPETKDLLGMEFISGWDIQNVAVTLALPKSFMKRIDKGSTSFLHANSETIYRNTTKIDRFLGRAFFLPFASCGHSCTE
ncbi:MAG: hypothetical protein P8011_05455 [Acidihalobacter sp.]